MTVVVGFAPFIAGWSCCYWLAIGPNIDDDEGWDAEAPGRPPWWGGSRGELPRAGRLILPPRLPCLPAEPHKSTYTHEHAQREILLRLPVDSRHS